MKLYNSLTKSKETLTSIIDNQINMYVCGITPYDTTHLGHAFTYMTFDALQRYLRHRGYTITYVQNVTDIDDDILKRAKQVNQDWTVLGKYWTERFLNDLKQLNMIMPNHYVKATDTIPTIIHMITVLYNKGLAYENNGTIYFNVRRFGDYGKLSRYSEKEMITLSRERGANPDDKNKKHPLDFILWQKSLPGEPQWESPKLEDKTSLQPGRPGWHIECSAMAYKYLGNYIDIHGGGNDLIYPHHESEIAQSESFTNKKPFSRFWMHTGAVGYKGEKMSKSLGNLVMVSDLLRKYHANTIRYLLLSHHYRKPWEYTESMIKTADEKTKQLNLVPVTTLEPPSIPQDFEIALEDDLNTPLALQLVEESIMQKDYQTAKKMAQILGFIL